MLKLLQRAKRALTHQARQERRAPIYLVSAAGQPNFGDEFITRAWLDWLAEHHPRQDVWLDCLEPGRAAHLFRDTHPRLRTTNTLWQTAHMADRGGVVENASWVEEVVSHLGSPRNDLGLRDLREMSSIHLLGGGYLNSIWWKNLAIIAALTEVKRRYGVRIFATGQGLLPHDVDSQQWMRDQMSQFDYAEARDRESASRFGIRAGTDDAFLAFVNRRRIYAPREFCPDQMVLLQADPVAEDAESRLAGYVREVTGRAGKQSVGFAEGVPPDDSRLAIRSVEEGAEFFPFMRMWEDGFPAYAGQAWLTSRFHFHLLAAAAGASGTFVNVRSGYYDIKHDLLLEVGTGWSRQPEDEDQPLAAPNVSRSFPRVARELGQQKQLVARLIYR